MRLAYWKSSQGNFGDDMNLWFWDRVIPGWREWRDDGAFLFGIGTILNETSLSRPGRCLILGSGTGYAPLRAAQSYPRVEFRFVRGPLTAARLGLPRETGISDPAILTPEVLAPGPTHGNVLFVPHHTSVATGLPWAAWCEALGVEYLGPSGDSETVIRRISGARLVLAESMHAAIIADAFRVPWVSVQFSGAYNHFKWRDWAIGLGIELSPIAYPARLAWLARRLSRRRATAGEAGPPPTPALAGPLGPAARAILRQALRRQPSLSTDAALSSRQAALRSALERTAADYVADGDRLTGTL